VVLVEAGCCCCCEGGMIVVDEGEEEVETLDYDHPRILVASFASTLVNSVVINFTSLFYVAQNLVWNKTSNYR